MHHDDDGDDGGDGDGDDDDHDNGGVGGGVRGTTLQQIRLYSRRDWKEESDIRSMQGEGMKA